MGCQSEDSSSLAFSRSLCHSGIDISLLKMRYDENFAEREGEIDLPFSSGRV